jgi:hypothetical protein
MRDLLRRIGARWGVPLGLVCVIGGVLIVARLADRERTPQPYYFGADSTPSVAATFGDDGPITPTAATYSDDAAVRAAATTFTAAWLRRTLPATQWLDGLRPLATTSLIQNLTGVDPMDVPDVAAPGAPVIQVRSELYAEVRVPIGPEAILLGMLRQDTGWLVDTLDRDE